VVAGNGSKIDVTTRSQSGPIPAAFSGVALGSSIKRLVFATRPKFFSASVLPIVAGTAWGWREAGQLDPISLMLALLATVLVHAGGNVINDVSDDANGTDRHNRGWIYPYTGGSRFIQTGILSRAAMRRWGIGLLIGALGAGTLLCLRHGMPVVWLGLTGIALGLAYSVSPFRLNARGLGELCVALAFGVLPVCGAAWLQGAELTAELLLYSVPVSLWVANILLVNEFPDRLADSRAGKRTLVVRLGYDACRTLFAGSNVVAIAVIVGLTLGQALSPLGFAAIFLLPLLFRATSHLRHYEQRDRVRVAIETTLAIHALGCLLLVGALYH
jgi:1,4-dihydroxy-2-naphthoate octaprenyltransferase